MSQNKTLTAFKKIVEMVKKLSPTRSQVHVPTAGSEEELRKAARLTPGKTAGELHQALLDGHDTIGGTIHSGSAGSNKQPSEDGSGGDNGSERFVFGPLVFDIDKAREMDGLKANSKVAVSPDWSHKINVDPEAAMKSDSTNPVMVAQIPTTNGIEKLLIDGHHRMHKAIAEGKEELDAHLFSPKESLDLVDTHPDMKAKMLKDLDSPRDSSGAVIGKKKKMEDDETDEPEEDEDDDVDKLIKAAFDIDKVEGLESTTQVQTDLAQPDAATENDSEPRIGIGQYDMLKPDALLALDSLGYYWSDATSSGAGNRAHGYPSQGAMVKALKGKTIKIMKADADKQCVYGVVLAPEEVDLQEDWMKPEEIEKTAHFFMMNGATVGDSHESVAKAKAIESYIAPCDFVGEGQYGSQPVKKGSWVLGVKILDPEMWEGVKSGEYTGFSVGGWGMRKESDGPEAQTL